MSPSLVRSLSVPLLLLGLVGPLMGCGETDRKLKVTGLSPSTGDVDGDTYVVIKGNRFVADGPRSVKVFFGSRQADVKRFASDHELVVIAPGGKLDEVVDVLVLFEPGGQIKIANAFKYVEKGEGPRPEDLNKK